MKLCNIITNSTIHLGIGTPRGIIDATAEGFALSMDEVITGGGRGELERIAQDEALPVVREPIFANVVNRTGKLLCVGCNYAAHVKGVNMQLPEYPVLFSKFADALVPSGAGVTLPEWETSYDYEAELVIVVGKTAWGVSEEQAKSYIFGYTCGNDLSCRDAQMRSGQWLIGKTMPGFGPCGPFITTADSCDPDGGMSIKSYVNSQLRQDGTTNDMIFNCSKILSYASKYLRLEPGDLIFTGTPSGVALEETDAGRKWLKKGDRVDIVIEGIGSLINTME